MTVPGPLDHRIADRVPENSPTGSFCDCIHMPLCCLCADKRSVKLHACYLSVVSQ